MTPRISVRNEKISDSTKEHIEKVCSKLDQYYDRIIDCEVIIEKQKLRTEVEFVLKVPSQTLVASAHTADGNLFKAVSTAHDRLEVQLKKYRQKMVNHH